MSPTTIIALVVAGFLLVFAEVFLPGGVLGVLGGLLVLAGIVCGFAFQGPAWGGLLLVASGFLGLVGFWLWIKLFPKTPMGRRLMLDKDGHDWKSTDASHRLLHGKEGVAHTTLRPAGTALIEGTFDLYWIAVDKAAHGRGVGRRLMEWTEEHLRAAGARLLVVETSGTAEYTPTRRFYERLGYDGHLSVPDFYRPGDDLIVYSKHLR